MEFEKVRKEHILKAMKDYQEKGLPNGFGPSSTYDIYYKDESYPPKAIMAYANYHATGEKIKATFKGGIGTDCFNALEREGFVIKSKKDPLIELVSNYKTYITKSKMQDEVYKWKLVNKYKGRPDINAEDFTAEIKSIKFNNLIYAMSIAVINPLAKDKPEELRELFKNLYNESTPLNKRISEFNKDTLALYRTIGGKLGHHQDERSMATYLTFYNPEKYTLYKSTFYKKFCKLLNVKPLGKNEKYTHYLELLQEFIDKYISTDQELIDQVKGYIPEYYDGKNHLLLAQDILYCMLNKDKGMVSLIQDFIKQADEGGLKTSTYPKNYLKLKLKVSFGQGVAARIPWIGLYKEPNTIQKGIYPVFLYYKEHKKLVLAYGISETEKVDHNWSNTEELQSIEQWHLGEFNKKPDRYGSSFIKGIYDTTKGLDEETLSKDLEELIAVYEGIDFKNKSNFDDFFLIKNKFDTSIFEKYIKALRKITNKLELQPNDNRVVYSIGEDRLNFTIGQRYCFNLFLNKEKGTYGVISKEKLLNSSEPFEGSGDMPYYTHYDVFEPKKHEWETIFEAMKSELNRTSKSGFNKFNNIDFENYVFEDLKKHETMKPCDFKINEFKEATEKSGLSYSTELISRYISSLATKPFVLLSGLSGSGKTKLAQSFSQWICEDKTQYCIVPVGADWTNREPLLGYVNALDSTEYILPENGALQLLIEANKVENINKPYFLILDEMNLSHVERYFADFLSVMESKDKFKLHSDKEKEKSSVPHELSWPKNLFVVGTVNIDETTYMFSPKVLDRANAIEFRVSKIEIEKFLETPNEIDLTELEYKGANMGGSFIEIAKNKKFETIDTNSLNKTLVKFFAELKKTGAEFGYRTGMEIHRLYQQLSVINEEVSENDKIDIAIMQKLLPKLHGSRRKICPVLETLANICVKEGDAKKDFLENKEELVFKENGTVIYPLSLEKITRMYKGAIDNGFASYAEA